MPFGEKLLPSKETKTTKIGIQIRRIQICTGKKYVGRQCATLTKQTWNRKASSKGADVGEGSCCNLGVSVHFKKMVPGCAVALKKVSRPGT